MKNSNLNYVVKETPYSAYITIRKKFIKDVGENVLNNSKDFKTVDIIKELKEENGNLKQENASKVIEFEELEIKFEKLDKENRRLEDEVNDLYEAKRKVAKEFDSVVNKNVALKSEVKKIKEAKAKVDNKDLKEKADLIAILEHTLNNKQSEIERLTEEVLNATSKPAKEVTIKRGNRFCSICSFKSDLDLQKHI